MYTAAVLRNTSAHLLRWITKAVTTLEDDGFVFQTPIGEPLPHHMTVNLGLFDDRINPQAKLGNYVELHVNCLKFNYTMGVCAAVVKRARIEVSEDDDTKWERLHTINDVAHITVALKPGVLPRISNDMLERPKPHTEEVMLDQTYILEADLEEVRPGKVYMGA